MDLFEYGNENDYKAKNYISINSLSVSKADLLRAAIKVGSSNSAGNFDILKYRKQILDSFFMVNNNEVTLKNIDYLETSEKVSISYFLGMIFTQLVAEQQFGISQLFHLQPTDFDKLNKSYFVHTSKKGLIPDLIGVDVNNQIYLFEAKGSTRTDKMNSAVSNGVQQLLSVDKVIFINNVAYKLYEAQYFPEFKHGSNRYVVATQPNKDKGNKLVTSIIDPLPEGDIQLVLNIDYYTFKYYSFVLNLLRNGRIEKDLIPGFCIVKNEEENILIGLNKELFNVLKKFDEASNFQQSSNNFVFLSKKKMFSALDKFYDVLSNYTDLFHKLNDYFDVWEQSINIIDYQERVFESLNKIYDNLNYNSNLVQDSLEEIDILERFYKSLEKYNFSIIYSNNFGFFEEQERFIDDFKKEISHVSQKISEVLNYTRFVYRDSRFDDRLNGFYREVAACLSNNRIEHPKMKNWEISIGEDGILVGVMDTIRE